MDNRDYLRQAAKDFFGLDGGTNMTEDGNKIPFPIDEAILEMAMAEQRRRAQSKKSDVSLSENSIQLDPVPITPQPADFPGFEMMDNREQVSVPIYGEDEQNRMTMDESNFLTLAASPFYAGGNSTTKEREGVFKPNESLENEVMHTMEAPEVRKMVVLEPLEQTINLDENPTITGRIRTTGHVDIMGRIEGHIEADGDVTLSGRVNGNVSGEQIQIINCIVKGNLEARKRIVIDSESIVIGDLKAESLIFDGKLKGNVNVSKTTVFNSNSYLMGDISTSTISIDAGAVILGRMKTFFNFEEHNPFDID